jgi:precorrin-6B methylase 2
MFTQTPSNEMLDLYLQAPAATPLLDLNFGFARARMLDTALELRLFTHIARGIDTCFSLAKMAMCHDRALQRLLDALVGLELLECNQAIYRLSSLAMAYLVEDQPGYLGSHLQAVSKQWDTWSKLTQVTRSGDKPSGQGWESSQGRERNPGMFAHVFPLVFPLAWRVANQFEQPLQGNVLDMFAGSGAWGIAMAIRHPQVKVIAQDEPALLETVRENVQRFGLAERFSLQAATKGTCPFEPESFSLIILSHACRFLGALKSQELLQTCYDLLQPGGKLLLVDVMANAQEGMSTALLIQLSLFLNTEAGDVFTVTQFQEWIKDAGFECVQEQRMGHTPFLLASREKICAKLS